MASRAETSWRARLRLSGLHRKPKLTPSAVLALICIAGLGLGIAAAGTPLWTASRSTALPRDGIPCFASRAALLRPSDLQHATGSAFTLSLDDTFNEYPTMHLPLGPTPPVEKFFQFGRLTGFLNKISLTGKYRRENDRQTRRLNGTPGRWPVTPLRGDIVRDNPTSILEVYESNFVWTSSSGSRARMARDPHHDRASLRLFRVPVGDESTGSVWLSPGRAQESTMGAGARFGSRILGVEFSGGRNMAPATAIAILKLAIKRVVEACGPLRG